MSKKVLVEQNIWELSPVFDVLTDEQKEFISSHIHLQAFAKNEIVKQEGDEPKYMMMLASGKVRVYKDGVGGRPQIVRMLKPYDFFGHRALVAGGTYNTSVSAIEPSVVYMVDKDAFLQLLQENNRFCYLFFVEMARDLGNSDARAVNLTQKHIRGRLAEALLSLKHNYGLDEDGVTISMYMSREDLANLSNMTTSNAIRTLSAFVEEGIVGLDGKKVKLLDIDKLVRLSRLG